MDSNVIVRFDVRTIRCTDLESTHCSATDNSSATLPAVSLTPREGSPRPGTLPAGPLGRHVVRCAPLRRQYRRYRAVAGAAWPGLAPVARGVPQRVSRWRRDQRGWPPGRHKRSRRCALTAARARRHEAVTRYCSTTCVPRRRLSRPSLSWQSRVPPSSPPRSSPGSALVRCHPGRR